MRENVFRQRQIGSHQERRPIDCVKAHNLFADQVKISGPHPRRVFYGSHVGDQRVEPNIKNMVPRNGNRDAPFDGSAADGNIF